MGDKGARQSLASSQQAKRLVDAFAPLGLVTSKKMFGGNGLFLDSVMFALVDSSGVAYLRADESTAALFEEQGGQRHGRMPYWQVPQGILDDEIELLLWGGRAAQTAKTAKQK